MTVPHLRAESICNMNSLYNQVEDGIRNLILIVLLFSLLFKIILLLHHLLVCCVGNLILQVLLTLRQ